MNPDGTSDKNLVSLYETDNNTAKVYDVLDGTGDTSPLKVTSHCTCCTVAVNKLIGGSENCVDVNNEVVGLHVSCLEYDTRGKYTLSAKTSNGVTFRGHIIALASKWEVNLGSWSDQSKKVQTATRLELTADIYPIRVWVGNADVPSMDDPSKYQVFGFGTHGAIIRTLVMFFWGLGKKIGLPI